MTSIVAYSNTARAALEAVEAAKKLSKEMGADVVIAHVGKLGDELSLYGKAGVEKVYHVDAPEEALIDPGPVSKALSKVVEKTNADMVIIAGTRFGLEVAPRLAQRLSTGYAAECIDVRVDGESIVVQRGVLGGTYIAELVMNKKPYVISIQSGRYQPSLSEEAKPPSVEKVEEEITPKLELVEVQKSETTSVDLEKAELIVSVGRGFKKKEDLALAEELASVIGAEIGCSRPIAGDLKWLPEERHIGLSGKRVRPKLYLALGISGQVQHLVGMRDSKVVIAINTDPNAPIMQESDYAVVGDLYKVVPLLTEKLKQALGKS